MHVTTVLRDLHAFLERQSIPVYTERIFNRKDDGIVNRYAKTMSFAVRRAVRRLKKSTLPVLERSLI